MLAKGSFRKWPFGAASCRAPFERQSTKMCIYRKEKEGNWLMSHLYMDCAANGAPVSSQHVEKDDVEWWWWRMMQSEEWSRLTPRLTCKAFPLSVTLPTLFMQGQAGLNSLPLIFFSPYIFLCLHPIIIIHPWLFFFNTSRILTYTPLSLHICLYGTCNSLLPSCGGAYWNQFLMIDEMNVDDLQFRLCSHFLIVDLGVIWLRLL